jgi:two-component sensor histidine kinase
VPRVNQGSQYPVPVRHALITDQLFERPAAAPDYRREKLALQDLARLMADHPAQVMPRLVNLALEFCDADSAGVSVLEGPVFRWSGLKGKLAVFEGATTPRDSSPCGVCLDKRDVVLMRNPEDAYRWIADAQIIVPEVLLVPLLANGKEPIGTLWVVAKEAGAFTQQHARVMEELAAFTGVALHMIQTDTRLKAALEQQESLAKEMSHRVKNVFAITTSIVNMTTRGAGTKDEMAEAITGRLRALAEAHSLARRPVASHADSKGVELRDLLETLLRPYKAPSLDGPSVILTETAIDRLALIIHELATNAVKYGALGRGNGAVKVQWTMKAEELTLVWSERSDSQVDPPAKKGFGAVLIESTLESLGGKIAYDWTANGMIATITMRLDQLTA